MRSSHRPFAFTVISLALLSTNCAPQHARAVREDKAITLGLPGASFHPTGKFAVGLTGSSITGDKSKVDTTKDGKEAFTIADSTESYDQREISRATTEFSPFVQLFPWDTSAFFVGVGATHRDSRYRYQEVRDGSTNVAPSYTPVKYEMTSTYLRIPFGWAWIWESGFSLTLDFGPSMLVHRQEKLARDGGAEVDENARDHTLSIVRENEPKFTLLTLAPLIGWSF